MIRLNQAEKVRKFIETYCIQSKAPWHGKPLKLQTWQWEKVILPLYGTYEDDEITRTYKRAILFCPKKQGKSTTLSSLLLFHALEQPGSECYCIASTHKQAGCIFEEAAHFAETHPAMKKTFWVRRNIKEIQCRDNKSVCRILSNDPSAISGWNANLILYDEVAEWPSCHARDVLDKLANATAARTNSLHFFISTAQYDRAHPGYELFQEGQRLLINPELDRRTLPIVYSLPDDANWRDPENWWKVNPSADVTVPKQDYFDDYKTIENNALAEARFRTFRCCQWVGHSEQWLSSALWSDCGADLDEKNFHKASAYVGLDMSRRYDLTSYLILVERDGLHYLFPRFFIPAVSAQQKEKLDGVPYTRWSKLPHSNLYLTPGDVIDPQAVIDRLVEDSKLFQFETVGYDPYAAELVRQKLKFDHNLPMIEVAQSPSLMSPACSQFERQLLAKKIRHPRNPVLTWNAGNVCVRKVGDNQIMLDKRRSTARIDGITAAVIATQRWMEAQKEPRTVTADMVFVRV